VSLLSEARSYALLLGLPLLITLVVTVAVRLFLWSAMPDWLIVPLALVCTPQVWLGVPVAISVDRYRKAMSGSADGVVDSYVSSKRSLDRLQSTYAIRERLSRGPFRRAVYVGYLISYAQLQLRSVVSPLNSYNFRGEEVRRERQIRQTRELESICKFAYAQSRLMPPGESNKALQVFIDLTGTGPIQARLERMIWATRDDGPGFLSTLTAATYCHFLLNLPAQVQGEAFGVLRAIKFDPSLFGWLSCRVLEVVIYRTVAQSQTSDRVTPLLQRELDAVTARLVAAKGPEEAQAIKWQTRAEFRFSIGLPEVA